MKQVTRNVELDAVHDLLERVPRACIVFAAANGPHAQPVALIWRDSRYFVGLPPQTTPQPSSSQEIVLLVDEGVYYFDLRAVYIRGQAQPVEPPSTAPGGHTWFELLPRKIVAWDYGLLYEVDDANE